MSWSDLHPFITEAARTSLAVGLLVALVLVIRKPFAHRFGAKAAYALWLVPLVRFVMPPLPSGLALSGWLSSPATAPAATPTALPAPDAPAMVFAGTGGWEATTLPMTAPAAEATPGLLAMLVAYAPVLIVALWGLGAAIWLARSIRQQRIFRQLIDADSAPASPRLQTQALEVARTLGLRQVPDIRVSLLCSGPLVTGLSRPVVLLPLWFEDDYTPNEQYDALVHELTHLRRRDLWAFQLARIVAATQWFNPLVYPALSAFRTDQESACDADVLRQDRISPAAYGRTLVKAARLARPSDRRIAAASLTLAHPIKERLIMMQHPTPSLRSRLTGTAIAGVIGTAAIFATASCMSAQAEKPEAAETETTSDTKTKEVRTFVFNGSSADQDHQFILLSDPFAAMHPQLENLEHVQFDFEQMDIPEPPEPPAELMTFAFSFSGADTFDFSTVDENGKSVFDRRDGETDSEFEARIEQWAAEVERKAEAWSVETEAKAGEAEARANVIALRFEKDMAAWEAEHGAKFEAFGARMEEQFGEEFEAGMEAAGAVVESLAEQCEARSSDDPTPEIVSAVNSQTGETHRAVCVNGDGERLGSDALADWVQSRSDLSEAEKATFMEKRDANHNIVLSFGAFDHDADVDGDKRVIVKKIDRRVEIRTDASPSDSADQE